METKATSATRFGIFVRSQLHNFEVKQIGFLLRIKDFNRYGRVRQEKIAFELLDIRIDVKHAMLVLSILILDFLCQFLTAKVVINNILHIILLYRMSTLKQIHRVVIKIIEASHIGYIGQVRPEHLIIPQVILICVIFLHLSVKEFACDK